MAFHDKKRIKYVLLLGIIFVLGITIAYFRSSLSINGLIGSKVFKATYTSVLDTPESWLPGDTTTGDFTVRNDSNIDVAVRAKIEESWKDENNNSLSLYYNDQEVVSKLIPITWNLNDDGYYYYYHSLEPGDETDSFIEKVTFNNIFGRKAICTDSATDSDVATCVKGGAYGAGTYSLKVTFEVIQSDVYESEWHVRLEDCNGEDVICINDYNDMVKLRDEVNAGDNKLGKTYILTSNIDMGGLFDTDGNMLTGSTNWVSIGNNENNPFSGVFNGNGHIIENLYINTNSQYNALFGYVENAIIKNLGIEDSYMINNSYGAGFLVGYLTDSTIDSCYNKATVKGKKTSSGIVQLNIGGTIKNSYNTGLINSTNNQFSGGIVGYNMGNIENCYNAGTILTGIDIGGIAGGAMGYIKNTYNVGEVNTGYGHGGVVGQLYINGIIENSYNSGNLGSVNRGGIVGTIYTDHNQQLINNYFLNTTADYGIKASSNPNYEPESNNNAEPLSASEMPSVISVINGDNAFVEDTNNINNGYPILKWEANR